MKQIYTFTSGISGSSAGREIVPGHTIALTGKAVSKGYARGWTRTFAVIAILLFTISFARSQTTITITTSINWSAITTGSGPGGQPSSLDDIIVRNQAVLTVDVANGVCRSITLGATGQNNNGVLLFNSGSQATVSGIVLFADHGNRTNTLTMTAGGRLICQGFAVGTTGANSFTPGTGTVELTADNTLPLTVLTTFNSLIISGGATTLASGLTATTGISVATGAALQMSGGITVYAPLTLNGVGVSSHGALRNISGNNTWAGTITAAGPGVWIASDAGTLTLDVASGNAIMNSYSINFGGAGDITVADPILLTGGERALNKYGTGTLTLSAANDYGGPTNVNAGVLQYGAINAIPDGSGISLNGGTFSTGAVTGYSDAAGALKVTANSVIALGTGDHTITFSESQGVTWDPDAIVTVTGWTGTFGLSGTGGKINFSSSSGLTTDQLSQIIFLIDGNSYQAVMLGTGEVVPFSSPLIITTGEILTTGSPFCAGNVYVNVPFTYSPPSNFSSATFTAQLSDNIGSFSTPVNLQSVAGDNSGSQIIEVIIPSGTVTGTGYLIRVVSNNPVITGSDNGTPFSVIAEGTWIGGPGGPETYWETGANWCGGVPQSTEDIVIPEGVEVHIASYDVGPAACNNLTVNGTLIINSGRALNVFGDLINNGTLAINSSSVTESGSLIVNGSATGDVTYNRYLPADEYSHYLSSPVGSLTTTISDGVRSWNEVSGLFETASITSASPSGVGYVVNTTASSLAFTGSVVNAAGPIPATSPYSDCDFAGGELDDYSARPYAGGRNSSDLYGGGGWNLLGNPFTSAMSVSAFIDENDGEPLVATDGSFDPNYEAIYIWDGTGYSYKGIEIPGYSNAGGGVFGYDYLQVGQGFFVLSHCNTSTFSFTPGMRTHSSTVPYTKSAGTDDSWPGLSLKIKSGKTERSTLVVYNESMTAGLDPGYDLGQMSGGSDIEIYTTLAAKDNGVNFARQALPVAESGTLVVPVGVDTEQGGEVTFSAFTIPVGNNKFWLEDRLVGKFTDLTTKSYTVTLPANTYGTGRFFIVASTNTPTAIEEPQSEDTGIRFWTNDSKIIIKGQVSEGSLCELFDLQGRKLLGQHLSDGEVNTVDTPAGLHGVIIVRVTDGLKVVVSRLVIP